MREKVSIGLIRVITLDDEDSLNVHGKIIEENFPLLRVVSRCIMGFPKGLYNLELERKAIPQIVNLALEFEKEGMKAVIISCADDPGVKETRKRVKIPVIGAGTAAASVSLIYGERIGVLGITEHVPTPIANVLGERLVGYRKPANVTNTLDIIRNEEEVVKAARELEKLDVNALVLGCTGYSTAKSVKILKNKLSIPVIDPVVASGLMAYYCVILNR
ncbi:MAG TPA: hydantoin racemase [Thermofilum sp.]|nr:hydantoin racemase [Thermofilum sp.]